MKINAKSTKTLLYIVSLAKSSTQQKQQIERIFEDYINYSEKLKSHVDQR